MVLFKLVWRETLFTSNLGYKKIKIKNMRMGGGWQHTCGSKDGNGNTMLQEIGRAHV